MKTKWNNLIKEFHKCKIFSYTLPFSLLSFLRGLKRRPLIISFSRPSTSSVAFNFRGDEKNYSLPAGNLDAGIYDVIIKLNFIWLIRLPLNSEEEGPEWRSVEIPLATTLFMTARKLLSEPICIPLK